MQSQLYASNEALKLSASILIPFEDKHVAVSVMKGISLHPYSRYILQNTTSQNYPEARGH